MLQVPKLEVNPPSPGEVTPFLPSMVDGGMWMKLLTPFGIIETRIAHYLFWTVLKNILLSFNFILFSIFFQKQHDLKISVVATDCMDGLH